jgi:hypothetical protein
MNSKQAAWSKQTHGHGHCHDLCIKHELQKSSHPSPVVFRQFPYIQRPLHEVLPKPSPPLHVLESGGILEGGARYGFPIIREYRLYHPQAKCHPFPARDRLRMFPSLTLCFCNHSLGNFQTNAFSTLLTTHTKKAHFLCKYASRWSE